MIQEDIWFALTSILKETSYQSINQAIHLIASNLIDDEDSLHRAISNLIISSHFQNSSTTCSKLILLLLLDPSTPLPSIFVACLTLLLKGFQHPNYFRTLRSLKLSSSQLINLPQESHFKIIPDQPSQSITILLVIAARIGLVPKSFIQTTSIPLHPNNDSIQHSYSNYESYPERKLKPLIAGLLYELCRVQRLERDIINLFSEQLIDHLFQLVELTRDQEDETFNYNLIKLIITLNEQFMIASLHQQSQPNSLRPKNLPASEDNIVIRTMKHRLNESKTFGENLIFILNRASHSTPEGLCVSLLILKILYLLFTTPGTHEYFYKNDLCVLVDIFIRELSNLPDEHNDLRHTYLRVLHPLFTQTQLRSFSYKREEMRQVLLSHIKYAHLQDLNPTTERLIQRNLQSDWCLELEQTPESSRQKSDLSRFRPRLKRFPSQDTLESYLSGGSSVAEVTSSHTDHKILNVGVESPIHLDLAHQDLSASLTLTDSQSQSIQTFNPSLVTSRHPCSPISDPGEPQALIQVIVGDADQYPGSSSGVFSNLPSSASYSSSPEPIHMSSSLLIAGHPRSVSPISEGSPRRNSSDSPSHSPARRPAPKPPISKRGVQVLSGRSPDLDYGHPSITQSNPQLIQASPQEIDTLSYSLMPLSLSSSSLVVVDEDMATPQPTIQRISPTPPHSNPCSEERTLATKSHRRKAPLPPPNRHAISSLRGTKSTSHLNSYASIPHHQHPTVLPSTSVSDDRSHRVVSLSDRFPLTSHLPSHPTCTPHQADTNPFAD